MVLLSFSNSSFIDFINCNYLYNMLYFDSDLTNNECIGLCSLEEVQHVGYQVEHIKVNTGCSFQFVLVMNR